MHGPYDKSLMKRGEVARRLISEGEDPYRMLAAVLWPGRDWSGEVLQLAWSAVLAVPARLSARTVAAPASCSLPEYVQ